MFGGVRDSEWTHVLVEGGERASAAPYLPEARKLLGVVKGTAKETGLGVVLRRKKLEDGTELEAKNIGKVPHVTIRLKPRPSGDEDRIVLDGFLVWPRDAATPDGPFAEGQPATYPQQVLSPPSARTRQRRWFTFAYDRFKDFWDAIRGGKDVYRRRRGVDLLPDGLRYYGNHHWRSPKGVVVSWHGPESGAIVNGARPHYFEPDGAGGMTATYAPGFQHGVHVFHFGKVLVNVTDWPTDYQRVGGACVREDEEGQLWLYVAQFKLPLFQELAVYRYRLIRGLARPGFDEVQVDAGNPDERELVWEQPLPLPNDATTWPAGERWGAYAHPARFSASGAKLLVYVPGREPYTWIPPGGSALSRAVYADADARLEFDVDSGAATFTALTIPTDVTGYAAIAGDYRGEDIVEIRAGGRSSSVSLNLGQPFEQGAYLLGERSIPMEVRTSTGAFIRRDIVRLSPADGLALLLRTEFPNIGGPGESRTPFIELWSEADGLLREWPGTAFLRSETAYGTELGFDSNLLPQHPTLMSARVALRRDAAGNLLQLTYGASAWLQCIFTPFSTSTTYIYRSRFAEAIFNPYRAWTQTSLASTETGFFLPLFAFFFAPGSGLPFENRSPRPEGLFHGGTTTDNNGFVLTRALLKHEGTVFVSCFKPGAPDESIVDFVPTDGDAQNLTGLTGSNLRLHPASLLGTPIYKTE